MTCHTQHDGARAVGGLHRHGVAIDCAQRSQLLLPASTKAERRALHPRAHINCIRQVRPQCRRRVSHRCAMRDGVRSSGSGGRWAHCSFQQRVSASPSPGACAMSTTPTPRVLAASRRPVAVLAALAALRTFLFFKACPHAAFNKPGDAKRPWPRPTRLAGERAVHCERERRRVPTGADCQYRPVAA